MRILAVDDDSFALELLTETLRAAGYTDITTASSGRGALEAIAAAEVPFDSFLLDIQMPGMDGIELCGLVRKMEAYREAPIIMITAVTDIGHIDAAFAAGALDYVTKPFNPLELGVRVGIAARLIREQKNAFNSACAMHSLQSKVEGVLEFAFEEPITIDDIPGMVNRLAMENYLLKLSQAKAFMSTAVAISIDGFEQIYARATPSEAYFVLADVADAIAENFVHTDFLMTYCGSGTFVCVMRRGDMMQHEELENLVQCLVDEMDPSYDDGESCNVRVTVGAPAGVSLWSARTPLALMEAAIDALDERRAERRKKAVVGEKPKPSAFGGVAMMRTG